MNLVTSHTSSTNYRADIDGLRALAVVPVMLFHAFPQVVKGGFIGVDIFFVISGYLITSIILNDLHREEFSFYNFYSRRINRIFPALLIVLLACFATAWFVLLADEFKNLGKHLVAGALFVSNFVLWSETGYFDSSAELKPLLHLWSLGIEEQFYVFWPFILWVAHRVRISIFVVIILLLSISLALNIYLVNIDHLATFYSPFTRLWELAAGGVLAYLGLKLKTRVDKNCGQQNIHFYGSLILQNVASIAGLVLYSYALIAFEKGTNFPGLSAIFPVLAVCLLIVAGRDAFVNRMLGNRFLVWLGLISFPLYLWHWPILSFSRIVQGIDLSLGMTVGALLLSLALADLTYRFLERPIRNSRTRLRTVKLLSAGMILCIGLGLAVYILQGYPNRSNVVEHQQNIDELKRTPTKDSACLDYINDPNPKFPYCRFSNANSAETVAIIGDSHAHVAYPGIASFLEKKSVNTLLLANSSCPPFLGMLTGNTGIERATCKERIEQLIQIVRKQPDIQKVFIFSRGSIYITGTEPSSGDKDLMAGNHISATEYFLSVQRTVDKLVEAGKSVYFVTEIPELSFPIQLCLNRPFRTTSKNCSADIESVVERQNLYRQGLGALQHSIVIDSLKAFCPKQKCLVFENDRLLYADDDHLSIHGSDFLVRKLLGPYLKKE